jgi:hypothetical protein
VQISGTSSEVQTIFDIIITHLEGTVYQHPSS